MNTIYEIDALEELRKQHAVQPHRMKLFRTALFKKASSWDEALAVLPVEARSAFSQQLVFESLTLVERFESQVDGATKLLFQTHDGHLIESVVLRPQTGRTSICISSQIGCACACAFCATGKMGFTRNLTTSEILDQIAITNRLLRQESRSIRNVVFMGMGEPLLNPVEVFRAVEMLTDPALFDLSAARITVSTVGIPAAMERFVSTFPRVRLALSLHSARQDVREQLMPQGRSSGLEKLRQVLECASQQGKVMIEYLMLAGVNDQEEDLLALDSYLSGLEVHINIIPFNAYEGCDLVGTPAESCVVFAERLKERGFRVTLRYSMGADIAAACGQLVQQKENQTG